MELRYGVTKYGTGRIIKVVLAVVLLVIVGFTLSAGFVYANDISTGDESLQDSIDIVESHTHDTQKVSGHSFASDELEVQDESRDKVFTASLDETVRAIDAETVDEIWSFGGHSDRAQSVSASPDGETVYSGSSDNTVRALDAETGDEIWSFDGHTSTSWSVSPSPDGETVYSASHDDTVRAIDAETGDEIWVFEGHSTSARTVSASPDGETVYSGSSDDTVRAIDAETGDEIWSFDGHSDAVWSVSTSPDGETVYSASFDGTVRAIDVETVDEIWSFSGHSSRLRTVYASPDGETVYSGSDDETVRAIDAETGDGIWSFGSHSDNLQSISASPDSETVYSASSDDTVRAIDAETGDGIWSFSGHSGSVTGVSAPSGFETGQETGAIEDTTSEDWNISIEGFEGDYDVSNPFISYGVEVTYNGDESTTADINYILESKGLGFVDITRGSQSFSPGETKTFTEQSPNGIYRAAQESKYYGDGELPQVLNLTTDISDDGQQINSRSLENNDDIDNFWSPFSVEVFSSEPDSIDISDEIEYSVSLQNQFQDDYEDTITVELVDSQDFDRAFYRNEVTETTDDGEYITFSDEFLPGLDVVDSIPQDVTLRLITDDSNIERQNDINVEVEPGDVDIQSLDVPPEVESGDIDINWSVINDEQVQKDENITVEILDTNSDEMVYDETETYTIEGSSVLQETTTVNLSEGDYKVTLSTETDSRDRDFSVVDEVDIGEPEPETEEGETLMGVQDWEVPDSVNWGGSFEYELVLSQFGDGEESITDDVTVDVTSGGEVIYSATLEEVTIEEGDTFTFGESFIHEADIEEIPQEGNFFVSFEESDATLDIDYSVIDFTDPVTQLVWDDVNIPETAEVGEEYDFSATLRNPAVSNTIAENYSVIVENTETVYDQSGSVELQPGEDTSISGQVVFDSAGEYTVTFESDNRVETGDVEVEPQVVENESIEINIRDRMNPNTTISYSVIKTVDGEDREVTDDAEISVDNDNVILDTDNNTVRKETEGEFTITAEHPNVSGEATLTDSKTVTVADRGLAVITSDDFGTIDRIIIAFTDMGIIMLFLVTGGAGMLTTFVGSRTLAVASAGVMFLGAWLLGFVPLYFAILTIPMTVLAFYYDRTVNAAKTEIHMHAEGGGF